MKVAGKQTRRQWETELRSDTSERWSKRAEGSAQTPEKALMQDVSLPGVFGAR
jgi:hypothetical protein